MVASMPLMSRLSRHNSPRQAPGARDSAPRSARVVWEHSARHAGRLAYRMGRQGNSLVAEWPGLVRMTCLQDGTDVRVTPAAGAARGAVSKTRGIIRVAVGELRGDGIGLHASAVVMGGCGVLFLGESGAGKSTAAAGMCMKHGGRLLADDATLLLDHQGYVTVAACEDTSYLTPHSREALGLRSERGRGGRAKVPLPHQRKATRPARLALVVWLRFDDALEDAVYRSLAGAAAVQRVLRSLFRLRGPGNPDEFDRVIQLCRQARFYEIARPHARADVIDLVVSLLGGSRA